MAELQLRERLLDAQFVEGQAEDWECPICKQTLLDPFLLSCCGNHYCEACVNRLKSRPCALCNEANFTALLDKGRQRQVLQARVHCPNNATGCEWQGELRCLMPHLVGRSGGISPGPRAVPPCLYEAVPCSNEGCREYVPRINLEQHQNRECLYRIVTCQYCNVVETTYKELTETHFPECPDHPVPCPNGCNIGQLRRSQVRQHCDRDCKLQVMKCQFWEVGCNIKRPRKDMPAHMKASDQYHGQLLVKKMVELQSKHDALVARLTEETQKMSTGMEEELRSRDDVIQRLTADSTLRAGEFKTFVSDTESKFAALKSEFKAELAKRDEKLEALEAKLKDSEEKMEHRDEVEERHVAMVNDLRDRDKEIVEAVTNDFDSKLDDKLSKLEEQLETRRRAEVTKLDDELAQVVTTMATIQTHLGLEAEENCLQRLEAGVKTTRDELTKLVQDTRANLEEKFAKFTSHTVCVDNLAALKEEILAQFEQFGERLEERITTARQTQMEEYRAEKQEQTAAMEKLRAEVTIDREETEQVKHQIDTIGNLQNKQTKTSAELTEEMEKIDREVTKVADDVAYIEKAMTPTPPFPFTVSRFSKRREKKESFVSEPFYTSRRGYRMVVRVDSAGTDTHVSVWCCITRGQHDDINPWPLRADISIRLINQKDKNNHYERQISYDHQALTKHAGRVTTGDKNYLWGLREFIPIRDVQNGPYLVGDALDFVVYKIELKEMNRQTPADLRNRELV